MNAENTTDKVPTSDPITTSAFGARLSLTQKNKIKPYNAHAGMNKGNAIFNDKPIAIKDRQVHIMAVINLNFIA